MSRFRCRLSYSNVVATLALFIALGGGAYAVTNAPRNSVTSKSIKKGAVKKPDLGANAVDSSKVGDGSLLAQDFAAGQLPEGGASMLAGVVPNAVTPEGIGANVPAVPVGQETGISFGSSTITPNATVVLRDLSVRVAMAPGAGATRRVELVDSSLNPFIGCSISGTDTTCNSESQTATVPAGSVFQLRMKNLDAAAPAEGSIRYAYRAVTP